MSKPVVLVLGGDSFANRVAELARDAGNTVTLASPLAAIIDKVRTISLDPTSCDSICDAFTITCEAYGNINAVLVAFVPQASAPGSIPGADQAALEQALYPSISAAKCALHYARRHTGEKTLAWLAIRGSDSDIMAQTSASSILGAFRSLAPRFGAQNTHTACVYSEAADETTARALVACIRSSDTPDINAGAVSKGINWSSRIDAKLHIVENGTVTSTHPLQGCPHGFQYTHIFQRLSMLTMLDEDVTRWVVNSGPLRTIMYLSLLIFSTVMARACGIIGYIRAVLKI